MNDVFEYGPKNDIHVFQYDKLVYVRNLKCASAFFTENFKRFGWKQIPYQSIDWENMVVFGHIIDPIKKRHTGIRQYLIDYNMIDRYLSDVALQNLLKLIPYMDIHSDTYYNRFGDDCNRIKWIALDGSYEYNIIKTEKFLIKNGYNLEFNWDYSTEHKANDKHKLVEELMTTFLDDIIIHDNVIFPSNFYYVDILYQRIWQKFYKQISSENWPLCPLLKDFNTLPYWIRKELATQHYTDKIKFSKDLTEIEIVIPQVDNTLSNVISNNYGHGQARICLQALEKDMVLYDNVLKKELTK